MALVVAQFFSMIGLDPVPDTMGELIPWQLTVYVGVALVMGVFRVIGKIVQILIDGRRW